MLSLSERIEWLEREFPPNPPRFRLHEELPFAILRYDPSEEWELRGQVNHWATRIEREGLTVLRVSLADLMWEAIEQSEGLEAVVQLERDLGFEAAQEQVGVYLSDRDFRRLSDMLAERLASREPLKHVCFLMRAPALGPGVYRVSNLLEEMHGRTRVPTVLFYPGAMDGADGLRFMDLTSRDTPRNYRVKIYG
jgi:hypothetical protein